MVETSSRTPPAGAPQRPAEPDPPPLRGLRKALRAAASARTGRRALVALQVTVAALLIAAVVRFVDWRALAATLAAIEPASVVAAAACLVAAVLIGAFDLRVLLGAVARVPYRTVLRVYVIAWSSHLALPGSAGDAVQVLLLEDADVGYGDGARIYLTDKLATLAVNLGLVGSGAWWVFGDWVRPAVLLAVVGGGIAAGVAVTVVARRAGGGLAGRVARFLTAPVGYARRHPGRLAINLAGTVAKLAVTAASAWWVLRGLGAEAPFGAVLVAHFTAGLVAYLPVAFNGIGTVEIAAVALYGALGVPPPEVVALYVVLRGLVFALALIGLAVAALGRRRADAPER
jgi:uncharacterized membrane protein YbhN (UPF0104 family)